MRRGRLHTNTWLGYATIAVSAAFAGNVAASAWLGEPPFLRTAPPGEEFPGPLDPIGDWLSIAAWLVACFWLWIAHRNARLLAPHRLRLRTPSVWLSWVIPFLSFLLPKWIVDDAWAVSADLERRIVRRRTRVWWGLWLAFHYLAAPIAYPDWDWAIGRWIFFGAEVSSWPWRAFAVLVSISAFAAWTWVVLKVSAAQARLVSGRSPASRPAPESAAT